MTSYEFQSLTKPTFRPSVYVGEVAYLVSGSPDDFDEREWLPRPAPIATDVLARLTKEEARQALAQVAEIALDMAENIDAWWKD